MDLSEQKQILVPERPLVVVSPHPLMPAQDRELVYAEFLPGETIGAYLWRTGLAERYGLARRPVICTIDGYRVPRELWPHVRPKPGTFIHFQAAVRGRDFGRIVGMVVVAVAAAYTGGAVGGAYGAFWGGVASAAVSIIGGLIVNKLFPIPKPQGPAAVERSPTYALAGGSNRIRPYEPMPVIMGKTRVYPDYGARVYTEFNGDDEIQYQVFDFGYNDVELSEFRIGDTPLEAFEGVTLEISGPDGKLHLFPGNVDAIAGGELTQAASWIQRTSAANATWLAVEITGQLYQIDAEGNIASHAVVFEINYRKVGESNWKPVTLVSDSVPVIYKRVWDDTGNLVVTEEIENWQFAAPLNPGEVRIIHSRNTPVRRTFQWPVEEGQYEVRLRRISADDSDPRHVSTIVWSQLRTYEPDIADYTGRLRVGLRIKASGQLSGRVEEFNCIASARTRVYGNGEDFDVLHTGTAQAGSANTLTLAAGAPASVPADALLRLKSGPGSVQQRPISSYDGQTKMATVSQRWSTNWFQHTGDYSQAYWTKSNATVSAVGGGWWRLEDASTSDWGLLARGLTVQTGTDYILSCRIKKEDGTYTEAVLLRASFSGGTAVLYGVVLDPNTGEVVQKDSGLGQIGVKDEGECWRIWVTGNSGNNTSCSVQLYPAVEPLPLTGGYVQASTGAVDFKDLQFEVGSELGEYVEAGANPVAAPDNTTEYELLDSWPVRETSNPAWWGLAAARGKFVNGRRVWGAGLPEARIDIPNMQAFAAWCQAKGLTFDHVFDQQLSVNDMLQTIANCGFASPTRATGKLGFVWDAPDQPVVAMFSMANIVRDSFKIQYANESLADEVVVSFVNPEIGYQRDVVRAKVPGASDPVRPSEVHLTGCQSRAMASKYANRLAAGLVHRGRRITWRSKWHALAAARGDVVGLSHDLASYDYSGRLLPGSSASTLKLSRPVPLAASQFITIVKPDQTFATYDLVGGSGDSDTVQLATPLPFDPGADPDHPPYDYTFLFGHTPTPGRRLKIESWVPRGRDMVEITAFDDTPEFYASEENPVAYTPPRPVFGLAEISNLRVAEEGVRAGQGYVVECTVLWDTGPDYGGADVYVSLNGGTLEHYGETRSRSLSFTVNDGDVLHVEVVAYSSMRRQGSMARAELDHTVQFAAAFPPDDVTDFSLDGKTFRWTPAQHVDVVGYKIRYHFGENRNFADAHDLHQGLIPYSPKEFDDLPAGLVTFFITTVDAAGRESVNPAVIVKDLGDPDVENLVEVYDFEAAGLPGSVTGGAVVGDDVLANATSEFYGSDNGPFYGPDSAPFYEDDTFEAMVYETAPVVFAHKWVGSKVTLLHELEGESILIEYRSTADQEPFYGPDSEDFYGPDAEALYGGVPGWKPWPGAITYEGGEIQFRISTGAGPVRGAVRELTAVIDIPDIIEVFPDFQIAPGGSRPVLTKPFGVIKTIKATLEDDGGTAVDVKYADKSISPGPLIIARDASFVSVAGRADIEIRGHA